MEKKQLQRFIIKATKFIIILVVADFTLGSIAEYMFFKQNTGKFARITQALKEKNADVFIFGSSHANRHYVPDILEKKLSLTCYNAGVQGQEILFQAALAEIVLTRISPKFIILNVDHDWLYEDKDSYGKLSDLNPYYGDYKEILKPILQLKSKIEHLKLLSKGYRFNSTIVHVIKYYINPQPDQKGFRPLGGIMSPDELMAKPDTDYKKEVANRKIDSNFLKAFEQFIITAKNKNVPLLLVASPHVSGEWVKNKSYELEREIMEKYKLPFIDFTCDKHFTNQYAFFNNPSHLNKEGAYLFSELLADSLSKKFGPDIILKNNPGVLKVSHLKNKHKNKSIINSLFSRNQTFQ